MLKYHHTCKIKQWISYKPNYLLMHILKHVKQVTESLVHLLAPSFLPLTRSTSQTCSGLSAHLCCREVIWLLSFKTHLCTAAAKSLQSCPTLCDPIPGILQARTLKSKSETHIFLMTAFIQVSPGPSRNFLLGVLLSLPTECVLNLLPAPTAARSPLTPPTGIQLPLFSWHMSSWSKKFWVCPTSEKSP